MEGRTVKTLNTLADHLPLFEKYARALDTGDVRVINRAFRDTRREDRRDRGIGPIAIYGLTVKAEAIVEVVLSQPVAQGVCFIA